MSRNIALYLQDIIENMTDAEEFIQDLSYKQFIADKTTFNAVLRSIEFIGEAVKRVPNEIRHRYPSIPWREMAANA